MGESYRGLTIRIGADTSSLSAALRGVNRDASAAESILRKLNRATRLDPSTMTAYNLKLTELGNKATAVYAKLSMLNGVAKGMKDNGIDAMRASIEKSGKSVGYLTDRFNDVDKRLEQVRREAAAVADIKWKDFLEMDSGKQEEAVRNLDEQRNAGGQLVETYKRLKQSHNELQAELSSSGEAKQVEMYRDLTAEMEKTRAEARNLAVQYVELRSKMLGTNFEGMEELARSTKEASAATESLDSRIERLDRALRLDPSNVGAAALKMDALSEASKSTEERIRSLREKMSKFEAAGFADMANDEENVALRLEEMKSRAEDAAQKVSELSGQLEGARREAELLRDTNGPQSAEYKAASERVEELSGDLAKARNHQNNVNDSLDKMNGASKYREMQTEVAELNSKLSDYKSKLEESDKRFGKVWSSFTNVGLSLSTTVTPAVQNFMTYSIDSAEQVDTSYRNMRKTVQGSEQDFERLKQAAEDYSRTHFTSADQILDIEAMGGQLGIATGNLEAFSRAISNINIATNITDAQQAAQDLGQLANITHMTSDEYDSFANSLTRLGNNNAALESDIMDITTRIGSEGTIVGFTTDQMLAWSTALASTGQGSEAAGTAFSRTIADIETAAASGGDKLEQFASISGESADQFAKHWKEDPSDAMKSFIDGLTRIDEAGGSVDKTLADLGINEVRQRQAIEGLVQVNKNAADGTNVLNDSLQMSADAWDGVSDKWGEAGDAANEAQKKTEGFSGQLQLLKNDAQVLGSTMADDITPLLQTAQGIVSGLVGTFEGMDTDMQKVVIAIVAGSSALGPLLTLIGAVGPAFERGTTSAHNWMSAINLMARGNINVKETLKQFDSAAEGAGTAISRTGEKVEVSSKKIATMEKVVRAGKIAFRVLAAVLATIVIDKLSSQFQHYADVQKNVTKGTQGLKSAIDDANYSFTHNVNYMQEISGAAETARVNYDELWKKIAEGTDHMNDVNGKAKESLGSLDAARSVISSFAGVSDLSAEQQGKLKAAIQLVNDQCGTQYKVVDAANGAISDSKGEYDNAKSAAGEYREEILKNIEAKKAEIKTEALTEDLKTLYDQKRDAVKGLTQAEQDLIEAKQKAKDAEGTQDEAYYAGMADRAQEKVDGFKTALNNANDGIKTTERSLGELTDVANGTASAFEKFSTDRGFSDMLSTLGKDSKQFSDDLAGAGVSVTDLSNLTDDQLIQMANAYDGTSKSISTSLAEIVYGHDSLQYKLADAGASFDEFSNMSQDSLDRLYEECNGDVGKMVTMLGLYNSMPIEEKDGKVQIDDMSLSDAEGNVYEWNGTELLDKDGKAAVDGTSVTDALGRVWTWNNGQLLDKNGNAMVNTASLVDAQGKLYTWDGSKLVDKNGNAIVDHTSLIDAQGRLYVWNGSTLVPHTGEGKIEGIDDMDEANRLKNTWNSSGLKDWVGSGIINIVQKITGQGNRAGGIFPTGGILDGAVPAAGLYRRMLAAGNVVFPTHADGGIVTSAMLTNAGFIGEEGAEAVVPLTNRRYVRPFAQAVAGEMGTGVSGASLASELSALRSEVRTLHDDIGPIIAEYAPTATPREFGRMVRRVV